MQQNTYSVAFILHALTCPPVPFRIFQSIQDVPNDQADGGRRIINYG